MDNVPQEVASAFDRLRGACDFYISLNRVRDKYYVYRQTSRYDKDRHRPRTVCEYLGRITPSGAFIKKVVSAEDELKNAKEIIRALAGKVVTPDDVQVKIKVPAARASEALDEDDKKILMALSMNGRIETPHMKKVMGISKENIDYRIKRLEKRYGIEYTAVVEPDNLGYEEFLAFIKFNGGVPSAEVIKKELSKESRVQLAILTNGSYDVLLHLLVEKDARSRLAVLQNLEQNLFPNYDVRWSFTPLLRTYGYVRLRDEFFEGLLKNRIWCRTNEQRRPAASQITQREYAVLRELSATGKEDFTEIDRKYGFDRGMSQYTYHQLRSSNTIYRITASMQKLSVKYIGIVQMTFTNAQKFKNGKLKLLQDIMDNVAGTTNKYALIGDIATPYGVIFLIPVTEEKEFEEIISSLQRIEGTSTEVTMGRSTIIGSLCYRRYDNRSHHPTWKILKEAYGVEPPEKIEYEPTATTKTSRVDIRGLPMQS
jgi:DNA-binding Lrp family transcriptional regulator